MPLSRQFSARLPRLALLLLGLATLSACAANAERRVAALAVAAPRLSDFSVCHGNGCKAKTPVMLTAEQWRRVQVIFLRRPAEDAGSERAKIAEAIAVMEVLVAPKAGTTDDAGRNIYHPKPFSQLDCIDEAANSTTYLRLMAEEGLIEFHEIALPAHRGGAFNPHNAATVIDHATGKRYVVDSWFFPNGAQPAILPVEIWKQGWDPDQSGAMRIHHEATRPQPATETEGEEALSPASDVRF